jgi:hypothetical protein
MNRSVVFFVGLFAIITTTVVIGGCQLDQAQGLEIRIDIVPTSTAPQGTIDDSSGPQVTDEPSPTPTHSATPTPQAPVDDGPKLQPTLNWVNVYSQNTVLNGAPIPTGSVVTAFDPDGVLAGRFTVKQDGIYGLMAIYMDDPLTAVDEGATIGDSIRFEVNGQSAEVTGPDAPVWTGNGSLLELDLVAETPEG